MNLIILYHIAIERLEEPVFVVPNNVNLSVRQMSMMIAAGQQPGVPFRLGGSSASRPEGKRVTVKFAKNMVSLRRNTLKILSKGHGTYAISFCYDAKVPALVQMFVGAKDKTTPYSIR
jgi:hypothetical protein